MPDFIDELAPQRSTAKRRSLRPVLDSRMGRVASGIFDGPARSVIVQRDQVFRRLLVLADAFAALAAITLAVSVFGNDELRPTTLLAAPLAILASKIIGLYDRDELVLKKSTLDECPKLFQLATLYALIITVLQAHLIDGRLGAGQIIGLWGLLFVVACAARVAARLAATAVTPPERCLLIGDAQATSEVGAKLDNDDNRRQVLAGRLPFAFDDDRREMRETIEEAIKHHDAHRVILAPQAADSEAMLDAIRLIKALGVKVSLLPRLFEVVGTSVVFDDLDGITVLGVRRFGLTRSAALIKRGMDVVVSIVGLIAIAPVMAVIAAAVRLDSPGPLFFRQERVGRDGHRFEMLKFRSMVADADAQKERLREQSGDEAMFKLHDDPRVTRVGRLLRKSSLDELPQFLNVLRGDMSLVGPRPLVVEEDELVQGWHRRRLHLVPGMTGPWQVLGSKRVPLQEMVKMDYLYIANWSLWRDMKIILRTVKHMVSGSGL